MKAIFTFCILIIASISFSQDNNDYYKILINTGEKPECIYCKSLYNQNLDNYLKVDATNASDIVIKMIDKYTENCARTVFIKGGDVYYIRNIPEGVYYLKIAYGYDWSKKVIGSFCFAKFATDAHYQEGTDLLDYNLKESYNGYQVPSYELVLRVYSASHRNEFEAEDISEEEFYGEIPKH